MTNLECVVGRDFVETGSRRGFHVQRLAPDWYSIEVGRWTIDVFIRPARRPEMLAGVGLVAVIGAAVYSIVGGLLA